MPTLPMRELTEIQKRKNDNLCQEIENLIKQDMASFSGNIKIMAIINGLLGASHTAVALGNTDLADKLVTRADRLQIYVIERTNIRKKGSK